MRDQIEIEDDEQLPRPAEFTTIKVGVCAVEIENIKEMRCRRGIDDADLLQEIRGLHIGDIVRLTLATSTEAFGGATLLVRVTRIRGHRFEGELAKKVSSARYAKLRAGAHINFTAAHIHSLVKEQPPTA